MGPLRGDHGGVLTQQRRDYNLAVTSLTRRATYNRTNKRKIKHTVRWQDLPPRHLLTNLRIRLCDLGDSVVDNGIAGEGSC